MSVRPLSSAWLANHVLEVADAAGPSTRWCCAAGPGRLGRGGPDFTAAREAAILGLLAPTPVPAPALLAADPAATVCDVPALLRPPPGGPPDLRGDPGRLVEGLAAALPPIHAVAVPRDGTGARVVPGYHRFYEPETLEPPAWSTRPGLWRRAFEVAAGPPPDDLACFIHRDYHPANTLWTGGRLTGVVDWIGGSWGPPSVDLGHMRVNLAADLGLEVADRFLAAHRALTGFEHHPWWDVASAVDVTPEAPGSWNGLEDLIAAALARLGG